MLSLISSLLMAALAGLMPRAGRSSSSSSLVMSSKLPSVWAWGAGCALPAPSGPDRVEPDCLPVRVVPACLALAHGVFVIAMIPVASITSGVK